MQVPKISNFSIETSISPVSISIFDYSGKLVGNQLLNKGLNSVQLSNLNSGLYFIKCKSEIYWLSKI